MATRSNVDVTQIASLAHQLQQSPQEEQEDGANGLKRKAGDDGGQPQQRARRNRYVSIACNECKRRKIKCNGQTPCQRCGNLNLECVYAPNCCSGFKDSQEYREMCNHIAVLQEQVNQLYEGFNALRVQMNHMGGHTGQQHPHTPIDPSLQSGAPYPSHRGSYPGHQPSPGAPTATMSPNSARRKSQSQAQQPSFRGPTSNVFNLGVAKSSLETMGITGQGEDAGGSGDAGTGTAEVSPQRSPLYGNAQLLPSIHGDKDPIWSIPQEEALRLCRVYEDEMGLMYPVVDVDKVVNYATKLYRFMEAARRSGLMQQGMPGADSIDDEDTNILKMVIATALTVEASGRSEVGQRMFEYVQPAIDQMLLGNIAVKAIRLLVMTAMYEFHRDNEGTSWRLIGLTARLCIELGLHRKETYDAIQDDGDRSDTMLLFWAIYVLDRRWSFGTGMPFALQDSDIDPQLPKPEDRSPYLSAMIQYSTISSKVWKSVAAPGSDARNGIPINVDEMNYLDYQVVQWLQNIPAHLRFEHPSKAGSVSMQSGPASSRAGNRLRILLYLRANQMRILIFRPVLHSATSIIQHRDQAQKVADVAKDTVRVLTHINQTSDLYRTQQVLFNAFLTSALAVLFLSVSHTPVLFADSVREEFYMALELIRGFSKGSWVSKRLWRTIRVLKEVGPKLGLTRKDPNSASTQPRATAKDDLESSRSAAVAMAGLAGHNVDEMSLYNGAPHQSQYLGHLGASSSPEGMVHDLTSLFEAAGGYHHMGANGTHDGYVADGIEDHGEEGLSHILKELF
ncbi:related to fungal specific transcription factor [Lecanosticta acicola]|uniref:Related to fungal specific transcription factor n=1 Tax=Lecanosticta acicola TaxID=111012 RepID=A0AAI8Z4L7_9PEZI|nr:related to fungal specific transcription factor [Lecanosticta acicola]